MLGRRVDLRAEINVVFVDPSLAYEFFIDGDWKEGFWTFEDLDELAEHLAYAFHMTSGEYKEIDGEHQHIRDLEGFPYFVRHKGYFIGDSKVTGPIVISYEQELESDGCAYEMKLSEVETHHPDRVKQ
jgi:hypothetical protein